MGQVSLLLWSWIETTRDFARGRLWGPFLAFTLVQWAAILLLTQFDRPLFSPILAPLLKMAAGDAVLHYPIFYLALPTIFTELGLILDVFVGVWFIGAAYLLFWQADHPAEPRRGVFGRATGSYGKLVGARLPVVILLLAMLFVLPRLVFGTGPGPTGSAQRFVRYGSFLGGVVLEGLFLYAPLAILVERRSIGGALKRSFGLACRMPVATLGAVLIPSLVQLPIAAVFRRVERMVTNMSPEIVAWALALAVLVYTVATFFVVGSSARLFRIRTEGTGA